MKSTISNRDANDGSCSDSDIPFLDQGNQLSEDNNKLNPFDMVEIVHDLLTFYGSENEILVALLRQFK